MTKREMFNEILKVVTDNADMVAFINHEIELLDNKAKSPRKPTATQLANVGLKSDILVFLSEADEQKSIKDITAGVESLNGATPQKVSRLLADLEKSGEVVRVYVKKVPYFSIA